MTARFRYLGLLLTAGIFAVPCDGASILDETRHTATGVVELVTRPNVFWLRTGDEHLRFEAIKQVNPHPGETVAIDWHWGNAPSRSMRRFVPACTVLSTNAAPTLPTVAVDRLLAGDNHNRPVRVSGLVADAAPDDISPSYLALRLKSGDAYLSVSLLRKSDAPVPAHKLIGAQIELTGFCSFKPAGLRLFNGITFSADEEQLRILPRDPTDAVQPPLEDLAAGSPGKVSALGLRRAEGLVLAVWREAFLLRTPEARIVQVSTLPELRLPQPGQQVTVWGLPQTDLFRLNLGAANFRLAETVSLPPPQVTNLTARQILTDNHGRRKVHPQCHGALVRLIGTVCGEPNDAGTFILETDGLTTTVDASADPDLVTRFASGDRLAVTGIVRIDADAWQSPAAIPRVRGFSLIPRSAADFEVLARTPWWTTQRLWTALGALLALFGGVLIWNVLLRRTAERRGRELFRAEIARASARLKVEERTRLAVELHDSLSQNLTGISYQVAAARGCADIAKADEHLTTAERMLKSSRSELRNCLIDLRSNTLEERNFAEAVRQTIRPLLAGAEAAVRFDIARTRLTDSSAHAILHTVRELVANARRHGNATQIQVAGACDGEKLVFSVRDNGSGFDPARRGNAATGHFGLDGIAERVRNFNGDVQIESSSAGTKVRVALTLPEPPKFRS